MSAWCSTRSGSAHCRYDGGLPIFSHIQRLQIKLQREEVILKRIHQVSGRQIPRRDPEDATFDPPGFQRSVPGEDNARGGYYAAVGPLSDEPQQVAGDGWTSATFETTVTFDTPGIYTLRAYACDAMTMTPVDLTVTVTGASESTGR